MILLNRKHITKLLELAKNNLQKDGQLTPVLFFTTEKEPAKIGITPLELNILEHDKKAYYFMAVSEAIQKVTGSKIKEAVFISDAFMLKLSKTDKIENQTLPISQNPLKIETITLCGRNDTGNITAFANVPYSRAGKFIVFEKPQVLISKKADTIGLIDYLFNPAEARLKEQIMPDVKNKNGQN